jgi:hypothetical protein
VLSVPTELLKWYGWQPFQVWDRVEWCSLTLRPTRVRALVEQCSLRSWVHGAGLAAVGVVRLTACALHSVHRQFKCVEVVCTSLALCLSGEPRLRNAGDAPLI